MFEAMLLQGFPRTYRLIGTFSEQVTQISNAVPPPVARRCKGNQNPPVKKARAKLKQEGQRDWSAAMNDEED